MAAVWKLYISVCVLILCPGSLSSQGYTFLSPDMLSNLDIPLSPGTSFQTNTQREATSGSSQATVNSPALSQSMGPDVQSSQSDKGQQAELGKAGPSTMKSSDPAQDPVPTHSPPMAPISLDTNQNVHVVKVESESPQEARVVLEGSIHDKGTGDATEQKTPKPEAKTKPQPSEITDNTGNATFVQISNPGLQIGKENVPSTDVGMAQSNSVAIPEHIATLPSTSSVDQTRIPNLSEVQTRIPNLSDVNRSTGVSMQVPTPVPPQPQDLNVGAVNKPLARVQSGGGGISLNPTPMTRLPNQHNPMAIPQDQALLNANTRLTANTIPAVAASLYPSLNPAMTGGLIQPFIPGRTGLVSNGVNAQFGIGQPVNVQAPNVVSQIQRLLTGAMNQVNNPNALFLNQIAQSQMANQVQNRQLLDSVANINGAITNHVDVLKQLLEGKLTSIGGQLSAMTTFLEDSTRKVELISRQQQKQQRLLEEQLSIVKAQAENIALISQRKKTAQPEQKAQAKSIKPVVEPVKHKQPESRPKPTSAPLVSEPKPKSGPPVKKTDNASKPNPPPPSIPKPPVIHRKHRVAPTKLEPTHQQPQKNHPQPNIHTVNGRPTIPQTPRQFHSTIMTASQQHKQQQQQLQQQQQKQRLQTIILQRASFPTPQRPGRQQQQQQHQQKQQQQQAPVPRHQQTPMTMQLNAAQLQHRPPTQTSSQHPTRNTGVFQRHPSYFQPKSNYASPHHQQHQQQQQQQPSHTRLPRTQPSQYNTRHSSSALMQPPSRYPLPSSTASRMNSQHQQSQYASPNLQYLYRNLSQKQGQQSYHSILHGMMPASSSLTGSTRAQNPKPVNNIPLASSIDAIAGTRSSLQALTGSNPAIKSIITQHLTKILGPSGVNINAGNAELIGEYLADLANVG